MLNKLIIFVGLIFVLFLLTAFVVKNKNENERISNHMEKISDVLDMDINKEDSLLGIIVRLHTDDKEIQEYYRNKIWK